MKIFLFGLLFASNAFATSASDVKDKAGETVNTATHYTKEQKDAFVKEMDENLTTLKAKIADMKSHADKSKDENLTKLEGEQKKLEKKISSMKHSSGKAWDKLHAGVTKAWDNIKSSMNDATDELKK